MPSLADIPLELLVPDFKERFLRWLKDQPINRYDSHHLMSLWSSIAARHFTAADFQSIDAHKAAHGPQ